MTAYFIVRAEVVDAGEKDAFDRWYQDEHLPDAIVAFNARRAWRGWSDVDEKGKRIEHFHVHVIPRSEGDGVDPSRFIKHKFGKKGARD